MKAGLRRAKLGDRHIGRPPVEVDRAAILRDRARNRSLRQIAREHHISRATVCCLLAENPGSSENPENMPSGTRDVGGSENAA